MPSWLPIDPDSLVAIYPFVVLLGIFNVADIVTGLLVATARGEVSSSVSFYGISRKVGAWVAIGACLSFQMVFHGLPLGTMAACLYIGSEGLSLVENLGLLGVPVPAPLAEALEKLKSRNESSSRRASRELLSGEIKITNTEERNAESES